MTKLYDFRLPLKGKLYVPLIVGGMGVDISTAQLALEMARLGAIGHISDAMAPWVSDRKYGTRFQNEKQKRFRPFKNEESISPAKWGAEDVYKASKNHASATMERKRGSGAVFINVMEKLTMGSPQETLRARLRGALDGGIDGVTLSAGLHTGTLSLITDHPRFHDALIGIIVSSARALKIFLRSAKRVDRVPDYIIVEGPLAGGHLGFGLDWANHDLRVIVQEVVEFLRAENLEIPVIPAGGVFTGSDAVEFLQLGAQGVQVATRFTISEECGLPTDVKQEYVRASADDVVVNMVSPTGYAMRMLTSSPCLNSNVEPNCEALGYILDRDGHCAYRDAYRETPLNGDGKKAMVKDKMCICYHFMKFTCYTCGHNVSRLKDTTVQLADGTFVLPRAEQIFQDYCFSTNHQINVPAEIAKTIRTDNAAAKHHDHTHDASSPAIAVSSS